MAKVTKVLKKRQNDRSAVAVPQTKSFLKPALYYNPVFILIRRAVAKSEMLPDFGFLGGRRAGFPFPILEIVEIGVFAGTVQVLAAQSDQCAGKLPFPAVPVRQTAGIQNRPDGRPMVSVRRIKELQPVVIHLHFQITASPAFKADLLPGGIIKNVIVATPDRQVFAALFRIMGNKEVIKVFMVVKAD